MNLTAREVSKVKASKRGRNDGPINLDWLRSMAENAIGIEHSYSCVDCKDTGWISRQGRQGYWFAARCSMVGDPLRHPNGAPEGWRDRFTNALPEKAARQKPAPPGQISEIGSLF